MSEQQAAAEMPGIEDRDEIGDLLNVKLTAGLPDSPEHAAAVLHQVQRRLEPPRAMRLRMG